MELHIALACTLPELCRLWFLLLPLLSWPLLKFCCDRQVVARSVEQDSRSAGML